MPVSGNATSAIALLCLVFGAVGGAGGLWLWQAQTTAQQAGGPGGPQMPEAPPVVVETVTASNIPMTHHTLGSLRADRSVALRPIEAGIVTALHVTDGDQVRAGQILLELEAGRQRAALAVAEAERAEAARKLRVAERLTAGATISQDAVDALRGSLTIAEARVAQAQEELARMQVTAPFAGRLGLVQVELGDSINRGSVIAELIDQSTLRLAATIPERYLPQLVSDSLLRAELPGRDETIEVAIDYLDPALDPTTRSLQVEATVDNTTRHLLPGQSLRVTVVLAAQSNVLSVVEEAIVYEGDQARVYVVRDGKAFPQVVQLGTHSDGRIAVTDGLQAGNQVITRGIQKIFFPGMPVKLPGAEATGNQPGHDQPADEKPADEKPADEKPADGKPQTSARE